MHNPVDANHIDFLPSQKKRTTARELQALLDANPNTVVQLRQSSFEIIPDGNNSGITIRSNRSIVMDSTSVIYCNTTTGTRGTSTALRVTKAAVDLAALSSVAPI